MPLNLKQRCEHLLSHPKLKNFEEHIDNYFHITERGSTIGKELNSGLTTFLTMSYILLVNPQILSELGLPAADIVVATALGSACASFICGVFGNLPFGLAPGMGLSAYLVYGLVLNNLMSLRQALTACFIAGCLMGIFAISGISLLVMKIIPKCVKQAIVVGMGLLISMIGLKSVNLILPNPDTLVALGDLTDFRVCLSFLGLLLIGTLLFHQIRGGILLGILILTIISWIVEGGTPEKIIEFPSLEYGVSDILTFNNISGAEIQATLAFLFIGIFDVSGVIFGLAKVANLVSPQNTIPGSLYAFIGSTFGTMLAASLGCTPIIVQVESAAGIKEGGKTGLTAVTIAFLFLLSLFFAPVFGKIPATATAPVLILVGAMMMGEAHDIDWTAMDQAIPSFLTIVMMPFTFSIPNGIIFGLASSFVFFLTTGEFIKYYNDYRKDNRLLSEEKSQIVKTLSPLAVRDICLSKDEFVRRPSLIVDKSNLKNFDQNNNSNGTAQASIGGYNSLN